MKFHKNRAIGIEKQSGKRRTWLRERDREDEEIVEESDATRLHILSSSSSTSFRCLRFQFFWIFDVQIPARINNTVEEKTDRRRIIKKIMKSSASKKIIIQRSRDTVLSGIFWFVCFSF